LRGPSITLGGWSYGIVFPADSTVADINLGIHLFPDHMVDDGRAFILSDQARGNGVVNSPRDIRLRLGHEFHSHDYDVEYVEHNHHHHAIKDYEGLDVSAPGYQDPHELAHANDIRRRFANREVTTGQIIMFGLTGGLIPCPASITVLLLCLQLKEFALGATLVLCFSIGLALTMVASGALAALSVKHVSTRWSGFGEFARKAPYFSGTLILLVGLYVGYQGIHALV
jgi:nickel/cobalt exporter